MSNVCDTVALTGMKFLTATYKLSLFHQIRPGWKWNL